MSTARPVTDDDLRGAVAAIAAEAGGVWRGSAVAFADRLLHRFDLTHQPVTIADCAGVLAFLRGAFGLIRDGGGPIVGPITISLEVETVAGREIDIVVVTMPEGTS